MSGLNIKFRVTTVNKGDYYTAICHFLNVVTKGRTEILALKNLKEEILFLFDICKDKGTIKEMLDIRVSKYKDPRSITKDIGFEKVPDEQWLDIGLPLEAMEQINKYGRLRVN